MKGYRRLLAVVWLWITIVNVVVLAEGHVLAGLCLLLFWTSAGVLVFGMPRLTHRGPGTVRETELEGEQALLIPIGRAKVKLAAGACTGMGAACLLMARDAPPIAIGGGLLFGAVAALNVWALRRPRGLFLTPTRIVATSPRVEIPRDAVAYAAVVDLTRMRALNVKATDRGRVRWGWYGRLNAAYGGAEISINADTLEGPPEDAAGLITHWRQLPTAPIIASG